MADKIPRAASKQVGNVMTGSHFKGGQVHEVFARASLLRRKVNAYFDYCDLNGKNYTVPGLALHLGVLTRTLTHCDYAFDHPDYQRVIDYALQRVEAYTVEKLFTTKGTTKGVEFLLQNTANYANRSDVKTETSLEVTEKQKLQALPDPVLKKKMLSLLPKLQQAVGSEMAGENPKDT